ncbi:hypothetical protein FACS189427_11980 [Planctomycetales bacterium]|nr:hypothetical protein FACS189427_11980 [Planctomycetales bacterium]
MPFVITAPHGCKSAITDLDKIEEWWTKYPNCNIGIRCKNLLVIDPDCKDGYDGAKDLANIVNTVGALPDSPLVRTGSGGWHLFFARPKADIVGKNKIEWQGIKTGIDIQVGNQYVVAPPSIHPNGNRYQWKVPLCCVDKLPILPNEWGEQVLPKRQKVVPAPTIVQPPIIVPQSDLAARCRAYVATMPSAVQGQSGHSGLLRVANVIFLGFG